MSQFNPIFKFVVPLISCFSILFVFVLPFAMSAAKQPALRLANLRVEYKRYPLGIDVLRPRLSWEIISNERGIKQTAYQVRASLQLDGLVQGKNLLWDSGKVTSDQSIHVEYNGSTLKSSQRVYWQVQIWDQNDRSSGWSEINWWEMGLLEASDWQAKWIVPDLDEDISRSQPCPFLRKEIHISKKIASARAYVTALGLYEFHINGQKVGDQLFTPGWTNYFARLQYQTYDITSLLTAGQNAIGVILGDGWYRGYLSWNAVRNYYGEKLGLLLQIQVKYQDGTNEVFGSDRTWKASTGPILESDIYNGEIYDAQLEMPGWNKPGYDDSNWKPAKQTQGYPQKLVAAYGPPVRRIQEIKPIAILKSPKGETIFDMGQNMVGWVRFRVSGPAGTTVMLKHAEVLDKDGNLYTENLRGAKQRVQYTLKGGGEEIFEPHFTFHGFRYVAVEGWPGKPSLGDLTGIVIHSDMEPAGNFNCSDPMINQLQHNIQWGQKGNFLDVPTDCPQRDERMGWTGDAQVFCRTACFNMHAAGFYTKWLKDLAEEQYQDGLVPHVIPDVLRARSTNVWGVALDVPAGNQIWPWNRPGGSAAWADAAVIIPWTVYLCYGDRRILEEQYPSMKAWVDYVKNQAGDSYLWKHGNHFGDWLAFATTRSDYPGATTDKDLIATAYFAHSTDILQRTASILNKEEDAKIYSDLLKNIKSAFVAEYVSPNGRLVSNTQTAYALALAFDLLPEPLKTSAAQRLADDVLQFRHITTGFVGANLINMVLSDHGYLDLAYLLLNRKEYPSWLYPITKGATTIWERWDGIKPDGSFQDPGMNSFNHYAYGAIGDWLYRVVAGIEIDSDNPGYKNIIIRPQPGEGLTKAAAHHHSMYGEISSAWSIDKGKFDLIVKVPANTTATIILPNVRANEVMESGIALSKAKGVATFVENAAGVIIMVGSGTYHFLCPWNK